VSFEKKSDARKPDERGPCTPAGIATVTSPPSRLIKKDHSCLQLLLGTSTVFFTLLPRGEDSDKAQVYELSRRVSELEEALRKAQQGRVTDTSDDDDDDDDGATEEETPVKRQGKAGKDTAAVVDTGRDDEDVVTMLAKSRIGCYKDDFGKRDLPDFQRGMGAATPPK